MLGWMNNWDYGQDTPTTTWRGTMALPREVVLTQTSMGPRLRQQVVSQADALKNTAAAYTAPARTSCGNHQRFRSQGTWCRLMPSSRHGVVVWPEGPWQRNRSHPDRLRPVHETALHRQDQLRRRGVPSSLQFSRGPAGRVDQWPTPPAPVRGPSIRGTLRPGWPDDHHGPGLSLCWRHQHLGFLRRRNHPAGTMTVTPLNQAMWGG